MKQAYGLVCGHCGHALRIRTSEGAHVCLRTLFLQCTNELCGATYRGLVEVTHQYSPSACANGQFHLPTPDSVMRKQDREALALLAGDAQSGLFDDDEEENPPERKAS